MLSLDSRAISKSPCMDLDILTLTHVLFSRGQICVARAITKRNPKPYKLCHGVDFMTRSTPHHMSNTAV